MEALAPALPKTRKKRLTYEDYAALTPPDSGNYELHGGKIVCVPSSTPAHQDLVTELSAHMRMYANRNKPGKVYTAPLDTVFDEINTLQPDILFISRDRLSIVGAKKVEGAPDFIIEIQSGGNSPREMSYKKYIYETFMVREYWVVNLKKETITQYVNEEGEFRQAGIFAKDKELVSIVLPDFKTSLAALMEV